VTFRFLLIAALFPVALPALAEDAPLPPVTPGGEYLVLTQDDATSTSKCIGDPVTPMCAVETVLACHARGDHSLCRTGMGLDHDPGLGGEGPWDNMTYHVTRSEVLTGEHFPWRPAHDMPWRPGQIDMQAGDIRIDIILNLCDGKPSPDSCGFSFGTLSYIVRKQGNRWAVMIWQPPYDVTDQ